jgi:hypothetical protein
MVERLILKRDQQPLPRQDFSLNERRRHDRRNGLRPIPKSLDGIEGFLIDPFDAPR